MLDLGSALVSVLFVGLLLTVAAFVVNRYARHRRPVVRRLVILFGLYAVLAALSIIAGRSGVSGLERWAARLGVGARVLEAYAVIGLGAVAVFDVVLPKLKVQLVSITEDILVGLAYIVATIGVLSSAGMDLASVVTTSAVVSGILALSLQATLGNILGGVALQLDGSVHEGDWLQLPNGRQGKVKAIRWRHTVLETRDWDTIIVPNASLLASDIIILGKREHAPVQHRMTMVFNVDFRFPPPLVIDVVNQALRATPLEGIAAVPEPHCLVYDLAAAGRDSFAHYLVRYWLIDLDRDDGAQSRVRTRVYSALERAAIPFARPTATVLFARDAAVSARRDQDRDARLHALAALDLFDPLTLEQREILADHLKPAQFNAGEVIVRAGEDAYWMYLLVHGSVEIRTGSDPRTSRVVATIDAPGFFGEMGLMTGEARAADVLAKTEVETYRLDRGDFEKILRPSPQIAEQISGILAHRRVQLLAAREGLDGAAQAQAEETERRQILRRIQGFFGLE